MRPMTRKNIFTLFALILFPTLVFGLGSKTFRWQPPTERENGDTLTPDEIANYEIACSDQSGGPYTLFTTMANGKTNTNHTVTDAFQDGTYFCVARTIDTDGLISEDSNEINFTVTRCESSDCRPKAPTLSVDP